RSTGRAVLGPAGRPGSAGSSPLTVQPGVIELEARGGLVLEVVDILAGADHSGEFDDRNRVAFVDEDLRGLREVRRAFLLVERRGRAGEDVVELLLLLPRVAVLFVDAEVVAQNIAVGT